MPLPRETPDAVMAPRPYLPNGRPPHRLFNDLFGKQLWGVPRVHVAAMGTGYFVTTDPDSTLLYPMWHEFASAERYDWFVVAEGPGAPALAEPRPASSFRDEPGAIKFGFLRDADAVAPPTTADKAAYVAAVQRNALDYETKVRRHAALLTKMAAPGAALDKADLDEKEALERWFKHMADHGPPDPLGRDGSMPVAAASVPPPGPAK